MLLVCFGAFTKFVLLLLVRDATNTATIYALKQKIFATFSVPEVAVRNNAKCFVSTELRRCGFSLGIQNVTTTPSYCQPSHAETFNRYLRAVLIAYHSITQH
jgi:hypothetical protein